MKETHEIELTEHFKSRTYFIHGVGSVNRTFSKLPNQYAELRNNLENRFYN